MSAAKGVKPAQSVTAQDHWAGPANAPVTLLEYGDYECPHCGRAHVIVKRIEKRFKGKLRFIFRHFPLSNMHPHAEMAAEAAEAAGAQGQFWEMHDLLYDNQEDLGEPAIADFASELGLDLRQFGDELASHKYQARVKADFAGGVRSGVNGTPTFFINGARHDGDFEYDTLAEAIAAVL